MRALQDTTGPLVRVSPPENEPSPPAWKILDPGRNCWKVASAERAAVLVDGAPYFARLEAALRRARRSIMILGWDFDGRIRLRADASPEESPPLGALLRSLVEANPDLTVHILVWSTAVLHAPGAPGPLLFGADWQEHPRIKLKLDTHHPIYAAHHQKIVCVDDRVAFVGGIDLTVGRWDTRHHYMDEPRRADPTSGKPHPPVHDIQMALEGDAARSLADLARARWHAATGEELTPTEMTGHELWPDDLEPHFTGGQVAIARTMPAFGGQPAIAEAAALTADALKAAQKAIYIEAQYITASYIREILAEQLSKPHGPEIVVVVTLESRGLVEQFAMGTNRDRLLRRLKKADRYDRLRVAYPCVPCSDGEHQILIHSKLIIVDDVFLRIGSSNLNNRSIELDTECDVAIEASDEQTRRTIMRLRDELLAEHLDCTPDVVRQTVEQSDGSLLRAIDCLNCRPRGLRGFDRITDDGPTHSVPGTWLLDPKRRFRPLWFV